MQQNPCEDTMSSKKDTVNDEDINLFRNAVSGTTPLQHKKRGVSELDKPKKHLPAHKNLNHNNDDSQSHDVLINQVNPDSLETDEIAAADILAFYRPGLQTKLMKKLRRGQFRVEDELDLHGYRVEHAYTETMAFLNHALTSGFRCVRIIHGKGRGAGTDLPILKNKVNTWLKQLPQVLAFCSAQPHDGGIGAVYVLLKRTQ